MIVSAFMAILKAIINVVLSILPDIPVLPSFIGDSLNWFSQFMIQGASILRYILGDLIYLACLDFFGLLFTYKIFLISFNFIKKYILMKG